MLAVGVVMDGFMLYMHVVYWILLEMYGRVVSVYEWREAV